MIKQSAEEKGWLAQARRVTNDLLEKTRL